MADDKRCGTCAHWAHCPDEISYTVTPTQLGDCNFPLPFWLIDQLSGLSNHAFREYDVGNGRIADTTSGCVCWKGNTEDE